MQPEDKAEERTGGQSRPLLVMEETAPTAGRGKATHWVLIWGCETTACRIEFQQGHSNRKAMGTWGDRPTRGTAEGAPTGLRHQQHCRLFTTRPLACLCFPSTPVTSRYLGERHRGWEKAERRVDVARTGGMAPFHSRDGRCCSWSAQSCSFQGSSPPDRLCPMLVGTGHLLPADVGSPQPQGSLGKSEAHGGMHLVTPHGRGSQPSMCSPV